MSDSLPTIGELFKVKAVTDAQLNAAVEVYLTDPYATTFPIADGYLVDLAAAVTQHLTASLVVANEGASMDRKRTAVRTAILLAQAQET